MQNPVSLQQVFKELEALDLLEVVDTVPAPQPVLPQHIEAVNQFNLLLSQLKSSDLSLSQFLADFGDSLFQAVTEQNQPLYQGQTYPAHETALDGLTAQAVSGAARSRVCGQPTAVGRRPTGGCHQCGNGYR